MKVAVCYRNIGEQLSILASVYESLHHDSAYQGFARRAYQSREASLSFKEWKCQRFYFQYYRSFNALPHVRIQSDFSRQLLMCCSMCRQWAVLRLVLIWESLCLSFPKMNGSRNFVHAQKHPISVQQTTDHMTRSHARTLIGPLVSRYICRVNKTKKCLPSVPELSCFCMQ